MITFPVEENSFKNDLFCEDQYFFYVCTGSSEHDHYDHVIVRDRKT